MVTVTTAIGDQTTNSILLTLLLCPNGQGGSRVQPMLWLSLTFCSDGSDRLRDGYVVSLSACGHGHGLSLAGMYLSQPLSRATVPVDFVTSRLHVTLTI